MNYSATASTIHDVPVLTIVGDVELRSADLLRDALTALLSAGTAGRVVVDLTRVEFFDSTGLHAVNACRRSAEEAGIVLALVVQPGRVLRLLEVTGLDKHFRIYPSADAATALPGAD